MTVARIYTLTALEGQAPALEAALLNLAEIVRPLEGSRGVELLRGTDNDRQFFFIERWSSIEAQKESGSAIPKEAFGPVMSNLDGKPSAGFFDYLLDR